MKTVICDIDGTIFNYVLNGHYDLVHNPPHLLDGVLDKFKEWEMKGCRIVLITGRRESVRQVTEDALRQAGIPFDMLIMGFADTGRVLINDINWKGKVKAHAVNLQRDEGFENVDWEKYEL